LTSGLQIKRPPKATKSSKPSIQEDGDVGDGEMVFTSPQSEQPSWSWYEAERMRLLDEKCRRLALLRQQRDKDKAA